MSDIRKFLKYILLFSIPLWIHIAVYIYADPFMVIYDYDNFYAERKIPVALDRDYVSTMTYIKNCDAQKYDSFIFGNSRSMYYEVSAWQEQIGALSRCYHFDASAESLYGVCRKMDYLDRTGAPINNVLFVVDASLLQQTRSKDNSHLFYLSPVLEHYKNSIGFHVEHWKAFLNAKFAYAVCDYAYSHEIKDYMVSNHFFENFNMVYNPVTNEVREVDFEEEIAVGTYYTTKRKAVFEGVQTPVTGPSVIGEEQRRLLQRLRQLLDKHHAQYKLVVSPLYDQVKFNPRDKAYLCQLFGKDNVFDYSGVNAITSDYHNYYEASHYRPLVAKKILQEIYR